MSATRAIQTAIYAVLSADATLAGLSLTVDSNGNQTTVRVYNDKPEGATYPHVLIGLSTETSWDTFGGMNQGIGWKDVVRIHVFSRYQGENEALAIHERVQELLKTPLTVSGWGTVQVKSEGHRMLVQAIDKLETRHLVGEHCAWVQS